MTALVIALPCTLAGMIAVAMMDGADWPPVVLMLLLLVAEGALIGLVRS